MNTSLLLLFISQFISLIYGARLLTNVVAESCKLTSYPPHPKSGCCGIDATMDNRIVGGEATDLRQYPWLAQIHYRNRATLQTRMECGGFLISGRYVVTAAHCYDPKSDYQPFSVKLGDYNSANAGPDCVVYEDGEKDCTTGAISVPIERMSVHAFYNDTHNHHDIALIRLKYMVNYTDTIRPICLPSSDMTVNTDNQELRLYSAGWGVVDQILNEKGEYDEVNSPIKMHVDLPLRDITDCSKPWRKLSRKIQICAGGETGKDVCMGDSGGPLMHDNDGVYNAVGIVSYGAAAPCGAEKSPGVYTKVFAYRNWIMRLIKKYDRLN